MAKRKASKRSARKENTVTRKKKAVKKKVSKTAQTKSALKLRDTKSAFALIDGDLHVYGANENNVCLTNSRGHATPDNKSPLELRFDASEGFIPVWGPNATLYYRFNESSMRVFQNPTAAKHAISELFGEALNLWGDSAPVKFKEQEDNWDFELVMQPEKNCSANGCTLARAFFPDSGRHSLALYPSLFEQSRKEQVETLIHELGHVFGLRHFFAEISESQWPSVLVGTDSKFTIMNYGAESTLTEADKADLALFYQKVWSGELLHVNNTEIVQFRPFHEFLPGASTPYIVKQMGMAAAQSRCNACGSLV